MNKPMLSLAMLLLLNSTQAPAQVSIHIDLGLPIAPPLVVVQPGIQVVEGFQEEVFFHSGWYWCRRENGWYRARKPQARFERIEARRVPAVLVRVPVGQYRNWRHDGKHEERREEHREERREKHKDKHHRGGEREDRHGRDKEHDRHDH